MSSSPTVEAAVVAQLTMMPVRGTESVGAWSDAAPPSKALLNCHHTVVGERGELTGSKTPGNGEKPFSMNASTGSDYLDPGKTVQRPQHGLVDGVLPNHPATPQDSTLSPVLWRHNPYGVSPCSPMTLVPSTTHRQSPCLSTHSRKGSTTANDATDGSATNDDITDAPSIKVCTRSAINVMGNGKHGRQKSYCTTTPDASVHNGLLCDGEARYDEELVMCMSRSTAPSRSDDLLVEPQPQLQHLQHHHGSVGGRTHWRNVHLGPRLTRANSMQHAGRISGLGHTSDAYAAPVLSRSLTSAQPNHHYFDVHPPQYMSEVDPRTYSHHSGQSSTTVSGSFAGVQDILALSRSPNGHNFPLLEDAATYRPFCSSETDPELAVSQRSTMDHFSAHMSFTGDFFTHSSNLPQHSASGTNATPFKFWGLGEVRSATPQSKEALNDHDITGNSRLICFDDDDEIEAYNVTLRPNEVNASLNLAELDDVKVEAPSEDLRSLSRSTATESAMSTGDGLAATEGADDNPSLQATTTTTHETMAGQPPPLPESQQTNARQTIDWALLEQLMLADPSKEVMCFPGCTFSVYDSGIHNHYLIESTEIVVTHGSLEYLKMNESHGTQSRFRFQLCKRYLNRRCTRGTNCPYIHTHSIPSPNFVHVNENAISAAAVEGFEVFPEELRGGKNGNRYPTMPHGTVFQVYPPNQGKNVPQFIPSEMILRTVGASNVYSVLLHSGANKAKDAAAADTAGCENVGVNVKARHCAHFQFNKMCNLGEACNFIHSLVPYLQRLSVSPQSQSYTPMMAPPRSFVVPSAAMTPFTPFPNGTSSGGITPPYPMEFMQHPVLHLPQLAPQQLRQPQQHVMPSAPISQLIPPPGVAEHIMYQRNISMMPLQTYVPSPVTSAWDGELRYAANYP
ncbi:hypothetical protein TraAM80_08846 [Trypanosoma rangeli]|uniref:C3H1-type domain-containing protein n=1 Tax=Trypanosoma rangeli TaxID=5698 RepID=A0A3R7N144_TRYRA|nr:uncharacterized protein TraAM80_08846 [Trypanosoma rangeli]RNE98289.1 hypothetical protein TraAM80_08846 [Trypanosoma rangeli]|eukprot:RNE98289.1 hypothetical protein TraAM80_08846 [Trypanosoma rangeli]